MGADTVSEGLKFSVLHLQIKGSLKETAELELLTGQKSGRATLSAAFYKRPGESECKTMPLESRELRLSRSSSSSIAQKRRCDPEPQLP